MLVHNEDVAVYAKQFGLDAITLRDPLPDLTSTDNPDLLAQHGLQQGTYVIVPWSFASDEPIRELFEAAESTPQTKFVMTWFAEKLPPELRNILPPNLVLTGYLDSDAFNGKRLGNYRIDPTFSGLPFLNSAAVDPAEPAPI